MQSENSNKEEGGQSVRVSVVIPAYNEEYEIGEAISEIENQSYKDREIIVVDDGSTDRTFNIAQNFTRSFSDLQVIKTEHQGPSHARNIGAKASSGAIIFFGECDCTYNPNYIELAVKSLRGNPAAGAACLTGAPLIVRHTLATKCIELENKVQHRLLKKGKLKPFYAWVYRREAFERVGGFDERLFQAEDKDLFNRVVSAGFKVDWVPGIHWRHKRNETLGELVLKWYRRGRTRVVYSLKHRVLKELARELVPFWGAVFALIALPFFPWLSLLVAIVVIALFVGQVTLIASISWSEVKRASVYIGYFIFIVLRNYSTAVGYSYGLARYATGRIRRKNIAYTDV